MKTVLKIFAVCLVLGVISLWLLRSWASPPPDATLASKFEANKAVFEELRQMLQADQQVDQVADWGVRSTNSLVPITPAGAGLSEARYKKYLELLKQAGATSAIHDGHEFRFPIVAWGFAGKGWRIAITYTEVKPEHIITNLDDFRKTTHEWKQAYRPLGDGWYLWIIW